MSDDKKRDRALQHRVRERQAKTGESYQAAWQQLTDSDVSKQSTKHGVPSAARRVPLSMSTREKILPDQSAQITVWPQLESFWPDRLLIKNANHWDIDQLFVGDWKRPDAEPGDTKRSLLDPRPRAASVFSLDTWHPLTTREVLCGEAVVLVVTYTGKNKQGECFEATLFGCEGCPPTKSTDRHDASGLERVSERAESKNVRANETIKLPLTITSPTLFVDHITITDAQDWVVNDIQVRGKSIFVQAGDVPGEMFSDSACVILEPLAADDRVEIWATYVGNNASRAGRLTSVPTQGLPANSGRIGAASARLVVELSGTTKPTNVPRAVSYFLPMSTGVPIMPTQSAQITARPQEDFLPERLVIAAQDDWIVNDIRVGIRCQLAASGDLPGQSFSSHIVGGHLRLDPVRVGQVFDIVTTRGEDCKESACFFCGVQGRAACYQLGYGDKNEVPTTGVEPALDAV